MKASDTEGLNKEIEGKRQYRHESDEYEVWKIIQRILTVLIWNLAQMNLFVGSLTNNPTQTRLGHLLKSMTDRKRKNRTISPDYPLVSTLLVSLSS